MQRQRLSQTGWFLSTYRRRIGALLLETLAQASFGTVFGLEQFLPEVGKAAVILILALTSGVWYIYLMTRGQTPGKAALGLYVLNQYGEPIEYWHYLLRRILFPQIVGVLTLGVFFLLDVLWPLWDRNKQSLHDKVAGTYVVHERPVPATLAQA